MLDSVLDSENVCYDCSKMIQMGSFVLGHNLIQLYPEDKGFDPFESSLNYRNKHGPSLICKSCCKWVVWGHEIERERTRRTTQDLYQNDLVRNITCLKQDLSETCLSHPIRIPLSQIWSEAHRWFSIVLIVAIVINSFQQLSIVFNSWKPSPL